MLVLKYRENKIFIGLLLVLFIVFNQNLGLMPLLADEPTRALVSLEMIIRNNFIFPTLGNEAYLNKPPLFNWILAGLMFIVKDYNEWHLRLISIIPLFIIAITHYIVISKEVNKKVALYSSIAFLTCGRILFYDSMMAYIDPLFSLVIVINTYWIFIQSKQPTTFNFFIVSYLFCLLAFFLKGLPALSFQVCTLLSICIYRNKTKALFSIHHITGIAVFLTFTAMYYYEYAQYGATSTLFSNIISQSSDRTPLATSVIDTLVHLVEFPIQFMLDFAPFSFFIVFSFRKNILVVLKQNEFIFLSFLFLTSNIWLYWISSETRARYLFMFLPMLFTILFYLYEKYKSTLSNKIIHILNLIITIALILLVVILSSLQRFSFIENKVFITISILALLIIFIYWYFRYKPSKILSLVCLLILVRITFNFYIIPLRFIESPESANKTIGKQIGEITKNSRLTILNYAPINHDILYYLTHERHELVEQHHEQQPSKKFFNVTNKIVGIHIDSIPSLGKLNNTNDTLAISYETYQEIKETIRKVKIREEELLPDGYYICTAEDLKQYKLKPILSFEVTYLGMTLLLSQK